jgi:hypothetical protein
VGLSCKIPTSIDEPPLSDYVCTPTDNGGWYCTYVDSTGATQGVALKPQDDVDIFQIKVINDFYTVGVNNVTGIDKEWVPRRKDDRFTVTFSDNTAGLIWGQHVVFMRVNL